MEVLVYHITSRSAWDEAQQAGVYRPPSLEQEGFIHLSYAPQRRLTQQRYYREQEDLLLLTVDASRLGDDLRKESGFPHLYRPLFPEEVVQTHPLPAYRPLQVALLSAVFPADGQGLIRQLQEVRQQGASLVVLPELPCNHWCPATPAPAAEDCDGGRFEVQSRAAAEAGVALLGGLIESTPSGRRNVAYLWGPQGQSWLRYEKLHLPDEPGFWEARHYAPGTIAPGVSDEPGFPLGIQICSDTNRPFGSFALRYQGAGAILIPRATESGTYPRWRRVFQALAQTTACYVLSVNRPAPEGGVPLGGPSVVVGPDGEVVAEQEGLLLATLRHEAVVKARADYPGYLEVPAPVYAAGWEGLI